MQPALYILTALTTLLCAVLLLRGYAKVRRRLLLWSGLCFAWLTISNIIMVFDLMVVPQDLYTYRLAANAIAMALLVYGLAWESQ